MEIRIALGNVPGVEHGQPSDDHVPGFLSLTDQDNFRWVSDSMPNRDITVLLDSVVGEKSITSWSVEKNPRKGDRLELVIKTS